MREQLIQKVLDKKIVAIVRGVYGEDCLNLARALYAGGIELLEVTFDQSKPQLWERTSDTIRLLVGQLGDKMAFGAGTVTTVEMVELAKVLSKPFPFVRVDFYVEHDRPIFGELTFTPTACMENDYVEEMDLKLASLIDLTNIDYKALEIP